MNASATSNGDINAGSDDNTERIGRSSDTNRPSSAFLTDSNCSSMNVQDFMSYLAKEANIANMTVDTKDGRRISATFKHGVPICTSTSRNGSLKSKLDPSAAESSRAKIGEGLLKGALVGDTSTESRKIGRDDLKTTMLSPTRDIATTMAMIGVEKADSTQATPPPPGIDTHGSREWAINYENKHVAVTYSNIETGARSSHVTENVKETNGRRASAACTTTSLPPKKRAAVKIEDGTSEGSWNAMSALVDAATVAQREHEQVPPRAPDVGRNHSKMTAEISMGMNIPTTTFKKKATKRKPRKIIPEIKEYVDFTQKDVLFGRGGRSNHHPGNKTYRDIVTKQQNHYRGCDKNEKTKVAQGIVDHIQNVVGGRFLELDRDIKRWFLVPNVVARRKVGQALRENNTEEARAAKRAKYQGKLNSKKSFATSEPMITANNSNSAEPVVGMNKISNSVEFSIGDTEVPANAFPIDDAESSNRVAV